MEDYSVTYFEHIATFNGSAKMQNFRVGFISMCFMETLFTTP